MGAEELSRRPRVRHDPRQNPLTFGDETCREDLIVRCKIRISLDEKDKAAFLHSDIPDPTCIDIKNDRVGIYCVRRALSS